MPAAIEGDADVGLAPLPVLPVFFKLRDRRVLIAGGGEPAVWKAELLCAAGARVDVVAEHVCSGLHELAARLGTERLTLTERPWETADLVGAALALGAIEHDAEAAAFRAAAAEAGVPVNVIDKPDFCDFQFGTLVARGPLVLGITTDGAAPVFGQALRARLESWLPTGLTAWAEAAKTWRAQVQALRLSFRQRRQFWECFADRALASSERLPTDADLADCLQAVDQDAHGRPGSITLVGSGPGTPESLTFAAARALQSADLLLFEASLPSTLVNLARREAARLSIATDREGLVAARQGVRDGQMVVWLGTGNPNSCSRWKSRSEALSSADHEPRLVDGLATCPLCAGRCPATVV